MTVPAQARSTAGRLLTVRTAASQRPGWLPSFHPLWLLIIPFLIAIAGFLGTVFWVSFVQGVPGSEDARFTLKNYPELYGNPLILSSLLNTLNFSVLTVLVSLFFGLAIAWLVERTDFSGKVLVYVTMTVSLILPGIFTAMGWTFLIHPRIGMVNRWITQLTGLEATLTIQTVPGMAWVQGLGLASLAFILTSASFRAMDPALEEAATVHGAGFLQVVRRIFAPLAFPGILASGLYIFTIAFAAFDVPATLGLTNRIFTFSTLVYSQNSDMKPIVDHGPIGAMGTTMVLLALLVTYWYGQVVGKAERYRVVTGKGYRPKLLRLGRWAVLAWLFVGGYIVLSKVLPLLMLVWVALIPYLRAPSLTALQTVSLANFHELPAEILARAASHSAVLMVVVPTLCLMASFGFSWMIVRSQSRLRLALDFFAFLPHAIPGTVFGIGATFLALYVLNALPLYGSLTLLVIVYLVTHLSFGTRLLNTALIQVHRELEEAAAVSGATGFRTAKSILAPLVLPALLNGWLWMALLTVRELTVASLLFGPGNFTFPVTIWRFWSHSSYGAAAASMLIQLAAMLPLVLAYWIVGQRRLGSSRAVTLT